MNGDTPLRTSFTDEDVQLAASNGAIWMDQNYPNWANEVDLGILDMNHCNNCIIGQVSNSNYYDAVESRSPSSAEQTRAEWAMEHGFISPNFYREDDDHLLNVEVENDYFARLNAVWPKEVRRRL